MNEIVATEIALRGAAAGINFLLLVKLLLSKTSEPQRSLGAAFMFCTISYILVSGEEASAFVSPVEWLFLPGAVFNSVVFWWFSLSLFDDEFRFDAWKFAPAIAILAIHAPIDALVQSGAVVISHHVVAIGLAGHAIFIALRDWKGDLVDPRRRFRLYFAVMVGLTAMAIGLIEGVQGDFPMPAPLLLAHAAALLLLSLLFCGWLVSVNKLMFAPDAPVAATRSLPVDAATRLQLDRLDRVMNDGAYRETGLTIAELAARVGLPEHQLRRLINQELGFRNFAAFLNERRLADARTALADPARAREQVLQIALDVGFGSIAAFNRAFKATAGETPTEYRRKALGRPAD